MGTAAFDNSVRIGYARVSTRAQDHQAQLDALAAAHCREVIVETASTRDARPKLASALAMLQAGDTLVIYKPDRVARSMKELLVLLEDQLHGRGIGLHILTGICAGLHRPDGATIADKMLFMVAAMAAEMERDLIRERTLDGLRAAQAQGRRGGRPAAVDDDVLAIARARRERGESVTVIARHLSIGRSTLYRALAPEPGSAPFAAAAPARLGAGPVTGPAGQAPLLTGLSSGQREQAMARFAVLRPHLEDGVPLARAAGEAGVAARTAQRWLARYRACGLAGLARTARADTGRRRVPAELAGLIEGLALRKPRPTVAASLDDLDLLLVMVAKPRMVHRDGIHFQGLRYLAPALAAYIREPVTIRYARATSPRSGYSTATGSSAGRSAPSTPARPSPSKTSRPRVQRTAGPCAARSTSGSPGSPTSCPAPPLTRPRSSPRRSHGGQLPGWAPISKTPDDRQPPKPRAAAFIATKEHRRFQEFACAVRRHRYIGLCYGAAGVGKTLSARRYARWDLAEPLLLTWGPREDSDAKAYAALASARTVFYTPTVGGTLRELREELKLLTSRADICIDEHLRTRRPGSSSRPGPHRSSRPGHIELLIIDEAERLSATALEYLRDQFDRAGTGLVLIGMPGIEKRMARYPQLYSRVGFAHHYRPLQGDELSFVLTRHWRHLGLALDNADFTDSQAIAAIARITGGNFRLLHRLFVQIERILRINDLTVITSDVVEAARSTLVIGDAT